MSGGSTKVNAVIRYKLHKLRGLVASLTAMQTAALTTRLASVQVAYTPVLAQSTVTDTKHPRVIEMKPAEGATGVSVYSLRFGTSRWRGRRPRQGTSGARAGSTGHSRCRCTPAPAGRRRK